MKRVLAATLGALVPLLVIGSASAASLKNGGLTVSPAISQINLSQGQTSDTFDTSVTNNTTSPVEVDVSTLDFTTLGENGSIEFLNDNLVSNPHGLASFIRPGFSQIALLPGASQVVPVSIENLSQLAPGGHYAAVTYEIAPAVSAQKNAISNNQAVSSLVFLTTYGQSTQSISLDDAAWNKVNVEIPSSINVVFTNSGNTQTSPRGVVTITNYSGKEVARGIVNVDSGLVLPGTVRLFNVALRSESRFNLPGIYHLHVQYQAGSSSALTSYNKTFLVITWPVIIALVIICLVIFVYLVRKFDPVGSYKVRRRS